MILEEVYRSVCETRGRVELTATYDVRCALSGLAGQNLRYTYLEDRCGSPKRLSVARKVLG